MARRVAMILGAVLAAGMALALALVAILDLANAAHAGGWATVTLDKPLSDVSAGESTTIGFMVKQHGGTPIHAAYGESVRPFFTARHGENGDELRAEAVRSKKVGHFTVNVTFPRAGVWYAEITPEPFEGTQLDPVTVLGAPAARSEPAAGGSGPLSARTTALAGVTALALAALTGVAFVRRRGARARLVAERR